MNATLNSKVSMALPLIFAALAAITPETQAADGWRTAAFGATEQQVIAAIKRDLSLESSALKRIEDAATKVTVLTADIPKLAPLEMPATVNYVMGYRCKCLTQVNVQWKYPDKVEASRRVSALEGVGALVGLFQNQEWESKIATRLANEPKEGEQNALIFFRGQSKAGAATTLLGAPVKIGRAPGKTSDGKGADGKDIAADVDDLREVTLIYERNAAQPDIYRVDVSGF